MDEETIKEQIRVSEVTNKQSEDRATTYAGSAAREKRHNVSLNEFKDLTLKCKIPNELSSDEETQGDKPEHWNQSFNHQSQQPV